MDNPSTYRDPTAVIDAIVEHIPKDHTALLAQLARIRSNAAFVAPEGMSRIWGQIGSQLEQHLNTPPKYAWEMKVHAIITGKEEPVAQARLVPSMPIQNGDHLQYEIDNQGVPPAERSDWPLPSFDAQDWAQAFCERFKSPGFAIDEDLMRAWFANALMRGFDEGVKRTEARYALAQPQPAGANLKSAALPEEPTAPPQEAGATAEPQTPGRVAAERETRS